MATPDAHFTISPLLALPAEIRLKIYKFVFEGNEVIVRAVRRKTRTFTPSRSSTARYQILLVCRQCHNEARPAFYKQTKWVFGSAQIFKHFTSMAKSSQDFSSVQHIQSDLYMIVDVPPASLPSIRIVTFTVDFCNCTDCAEEDPVDRSSWTQAGVAKANQKEINAYVNSFARVFAASRLKRDGPPPSLPKQIKIQLRMSFWEATYDNNADCYYSVKRLSDGEQSQHTTLKAKVYLVTSK